MTRQTANDLPSPPTGAQQGYDANETEPAKGVRIGRRRILWIPALLAATRLLGAVPRGLAQEAEDRTTRTEGEPAPIVPPLAPPASRLAWQEFLERTVALAGRLYPDSSPEGQDAYLMAISAEAVRIESVPEGTSGRFSGLDPAVRFGLIHQGAPFVVVQWWMEPRAVLPAHCHPRASVCTVGIAGEVRLRHFELEPGAPAYDSGASRPFRMRETRSQILGDRDISTLSATRDNIHYFEAGPDGARGIDITTGYGGDGSFSFIDFDPDRPVDAARQIYEGVWIGSKL